MIMTHPINKLPVRLGTRHVLYMEHLKREKEREIALEECNGDQKQTAWRASRGEKPSF